jgi:hypothetical protein
VRVPMKKTCGASLPGVIIFDGTQRTLAHELAHHACLIAGLPVPHDERFVTAVAACLVVPRAAFRRAHRHDQLPERLALTFGVRDSCAAMRVGETTGAPIAVVTPTRVFARGDWEWPAEDLLRRMVRHGSPRISVRPLSGNARRLLVTPTRNHQS